MKAQGKSSKQSRRHTPSLAFALAAAISFISPSAHAVTECYVTPISMHVGDDGALYVLYSNSGSGKIFQSDVDFKPTLAVVMSAILSERDVTVRYAADGVACTATFQPLMGIWMSR